MSISGRLPILFFSILYFVVPFCSSFRIPSCKLASFRENISHFICTKYEGIIEYEKLLSSCKVKIPRFLGTIIIASTCAVINPVTFPTNGNNYQPNSASRLFRISLSTALARNLPEDNGAIGLSRGTAKSLAPIIRIRNILSQARESLPGRVNSPPDGCDDLLCLEPGMEDACNNLLKQIPGTEQGFKRLFDEFSEGVTYKQQYLDKNAFVVYYTKGFDGPGRQSIEVDEDGRSAFMAEQYGWRNEAWNALVSARADLVYLRSLTEGILRRTPLPTTQAQMQERLIALNDLRDDLKQASEAIRRYLALAPDEVLMEAEVLYNVSAGSGSQ